ncbi:MAG TPA: metallophosphoesterase family protein [Firmicutes bacterium]|nr:metallophosphoesterase family protein [Bacillota bacterium]
MRKAKKTAAVLLAASVAVTSGITAFAIPSTNPETNGNKTAYDSWKVQWDTEKQDYTDVSITPGKDETQMNFAWYVAQADAGKTAQVKIATSQDMSDAKVFKESGSLSINVTNENGSGSTTYTKAAHVTVTGLTENTTYYYQVSNDGSSWSEAEKLATGDTSAYTMLYVGDPQIGSSGSAAHDAFNWNETLNAALKQNSDLDFILSAGDQTEKSSQNADENKDVEVEYAGYLSADALQNIPVATAIGNHEASGAYYGYHFYNPNESDLGSTTAGGDYYFSYGKTLFIVLNSNNTNQEEHRQLMQQAIDSDKDATFRIVMFHHDIYGAGQPHANSDGAQLRTVFAPLMDEFNIDVCLTGHDHSYSRTYQILDGVAIDYDVKDGGTVTDPQGTLYMTANSASGSKYYETVKTQQYFISNMSQQALPTYSVIKMTDNSFTISTYAVNAGGSVTDTGDTLTIVKEADKDSLLSLIGDAQDKVDSTDPETVTSSSLTALQEALDKANTLLNTSEDGKDESNVWNPANEGDATNAEGYDNPTQSPEPDQIPDKTQDSLQGQISQQELTDTYTALLTAMNGLTQRGDATELNTTIDEAQKLLDGVQVGSEAGQVTQDDHDALQKAIDTAKAVAASTDADAAAMEQAIKDLEAAEETFRAAVIKDDASTQKPDDSTTPDDNQSQTGDHTDNTQNDTNNSTPSDTNNNTDSVPQTGDTSRTVGILLTVLLLAGGTATALVWRRRHAE